MGNTTQLRYIDQLALFKLRGMSGIRLEWSLYDINHQNRDKRTKERYNLKKQLRTISTLGYYQLKSYSLPYMNDNNIYNNVSFKNVVDRYYRDMHLRQCTLQVIENIEVTLNTKIAYVLGQKYGPYGYLKFNNWCQINSNNRYLTSRNKNGKRIPYRYMGVKEVLNEQRNFIVALSKKISKSSSIDIKKIRLKDKSAQIPIWLIVNELTLGESIHIYKLMSKRNKLMIANFFKCSTDELASWLDCINLVRNICCHNGNLSDIRLITKPKLPKRLISDVLFSVKLKNGHIKYSNRLALPLWVIVNMIMIINPKYKFDELRRSVMKLVDETTDITYYGFKNSAALDKILNVKQISDKLPLSFSSDLY